MLPSCAEMHGTDFVCALSNEQYNAYIEDACHEQNMHE